MTIPKQAIDAAAKAIADSIGHGMSEKCFDHARAALTAAAPHMSGSAREQALEDDMRMGIIDLLHNLRFRLEAPGATIETDRKLVGQIIEMVDALKSKPAPDGWQPIEDSTPRDQVILAWGNNWHWEGVEKAYLHIDYNGHKNVICRGGMAGEPFTLGRQDAPTHWHPIPPAPQTGGGE